MSKFCHKCSIAALDLGEDSAEYHFWHEGHVDFGECSINFHGPSESMEAEGGLVLWKRSVEECQMRYTTLLGDGDAKTYTLVCKMKPYGPDVVITKEECTNHVSKRLGKGLETLVAAEKKTGAPLGGKGEGTLKETTIRTMQGYYQAALKENAPDKEKMKTAVMATLEHCHSTDQKYNHRLCPEGEESWCYFNKRKARGMKAKDIKGHSDMPIKINDRVYKAVLPIYTRLSG